MIRFAATLKRQLRRAIKAGELTPVQQESAAKIIRRDKQSRLAFRELLANCAAIKGFAGVCSRANDEDSEHPIIDWIKRNWDRLLSLIVSIVLAFLL